MEIPVPGAFSQVMTTLLLPPTRHHITSNVYTHIHIPFSTTVI